MPSRVQGRAALSVSLQARYALPRLSTASPFLEHQSGRYLCLGVSWKVEPQHPGARHDWKLDSNNALGFLPRFQTFGADLPVYDFNRNLPGRFQMSRFLLAELRSRDSS